MMSTNIKHKQHAGIPIYYNAMSMNISQAAAKKYRQKH